VSATAALSLDHIAKRFGQTEALVDATLHARTASLHALLGENGAGKTTLMRIAYGLTEPDAGSMRIDGFPVRLSTPADAIRHGIGMVQQHFTIAPAMTVAENVALGGHGRFDVRATADRIREIAAATGLTLDPGLRAGTLGVAAQQRLEIIKALARDARVLILDEPTAALPPAEAADLVQRLRILARGGLTVILRTHKLREALAVADDVTVLRRGATVLSAPASTLDHSVVADAMLGGAWTAVADRGRSGVSSTRLPVARARDITVLDDRRVERVQGVKMDVHGGEIVGIAGVEGSGVHELLRALAGRLDVTRGTIERPSAIGFIPEDRHREAIALDFSVVENVALRGAGSRRGIARWGASRARAEKLLGEFDVRAAGIDAPLSALSGGNQQKLVLARELAEQPALLVAENPTHGLDVRATAAIHARLLDARDAGTGIVIYSSDLDELLMLADRVFAMHSGSLLATEHDRDSIGQAMLGMRGRGSA
jgi:general nucleoside transport system ATP-binding protein